MTDNQKRRRKEFAGLLLIGALWGAGTAVASASGFELDTYGIKQLGAGLAGAAAYAPDPSALAYNPATVSALSGTRVSGSVTAVQLHGEFSGSAYDRLTGQPVAGGNGGNLGGTYAIPALFATTRLSPRWTVGVGLYSKYDTVTSYKSGWTGRYNALLSDIKAVNLNPVVAFRVTPTLSVGAGLYVQYFKARLTNAVDLSGGKAPGAYDVISDLHGHDITAGATLGLAWQPRPGTRLGLSYRTADTARVKGSLVLPPVAGGAQSATVHVAMPDEVIAGVSQAVGPRLTLLGGVEWFGWGRFQALHIHLQNGGKVNIAEDYHNSWRLSAGAAWQLDPRWTVRAGLAFDQSPVRSPGRDARVPDSNRVELTVGASYAASRHWRFDAGYMHVFFNNAGINHLDTSGAYRLQGSYSVRSDLLGVQANYRF